MSAPTPQSVSAHLRRLGWRPTGNRNREGLRVKRSHAGVRVVADWDRPAEAARMASDVAADLTEAGYTVVLSDDAAMYVTGGSS